jgi:hypothetical protein
LKVFIIFVVRKLTSEIIQNNIDKLESAKREFKILQDYDQELDEFKLKQLYNEAKNYGLLSYLLFIDYQKSIKKLNQQVFYNKKISLKEFTAIDPKVKKVLESKGKVSFEKFINSPRWDLYSGHRRRRGGVRYHDNFLCSSAIIANFCIQNELEIEDPSRISDYYRNTLPSIDSTVNKEIELTNHLVDFMFDSLSKQDYDFRKINVENIVKFIQTEIERKMKTVEEGESVKLVETTDFYSGLTENKIYTIKSKEIHSGRLNVNIENDLGFTRSYPYRLFETVTNLRNSALDEILNNL